MVGSLKLSIINPFGYGLEYVRLVNSSYLSPPLDVTFKHDHLHSFYIANLLEMGILGFLIFLKLFLFILKKARTNIKNSINREEFAMNSSIYVGICTCGFHLVFANNILRSEAVYMSVFLLLVALIFHINQKNNI